MSGEITFTTNALSKMLLHAAKYPHLAVNGILIGTSSKKDGGSTMMVYDTIPLFHGQIGLAPMLEVGLTQSEHIFKSQSWITVGYYQGNENIKDNVPDFVAMKIAEKIAENNNEACLVMIDNPKMSFKLDTAPILVSHLGTEGRWKNKEKSGVHIESGALSITSQLLQKRVHHEIYDFDNHLDDITCDFTNKQINSLISSLKAASGH